MPLPDAPDLRVEFSPSTNPGSAPVWVDISDYVLEWNTRRGRQHELDRTEAGTGSITLLNWDRRFEPLNLSSPYYPGIKPTRRLRIRGTWDGQTHDVIGGFIEGIPLNYSEGGFQETVTLPLVDGFKPLARAKISASYPSQLSGARITEVLDDAGWPAADRDIDPGISTLIASTLVDQPALAHILDVHTAEMGLVFIDRAGRFVFLDRHSFFLGSEDYTNRTWGDLETSSEWLYENIVPVYDDSNIWNEANVTREGGTLQNAQDATSIDEHFRSTLTRSGVLLSTDNEAFDQAHYLKTRYAFPEIRFESMELKPQMQPEQWLHVLSRDLGDRIRVRRRPQEGGLIEKTCFIQGISHSWSADAGEWLVSFQLSPIDVAANFWILDSATRSVLDSTTRLGV